MKANKLITRVIVLSYITPKQDLYFNALVFLTFLK